MTFKGLTLSIALLLPITTSAQNDDNVLAEPRILLDTIQVNSGLPDPLVSLPEYVCYVQGVETLRIGENEISELPACIGFLTQNLRMLQIAGNPMGGWLDIQRRLPNVETLLLESVPLSEGFSWHGSPFIETIQISNCNLSNAPLKIASNPVLRRLTVEGCNLNNSTVSQLHFLAGLSNLEFLSLRDNGLSTIPTGLPFLTSLQTLDLSGNNFSEPQKAEILALFQGRQVNVQF